MNKLKQIPNIAELASYYIQVKEYRDFHKDSTPYTAIRKALIYLIFLTSDLEI
jgi:hypothetical protein